MKFWQVAAAILIFKIFDLCFELAGAWAGNAGAGLVYIAAIFIWIIAALVIWQTFRELGQVGERFGPRNG